MWLSQAMGTSSFIVNFYMWATLVIWTLTGLCGLCWLVCHDGTFESQTVDVNFESLKRGIRRQDGVDFFFGFMVFIAYFLTGIVVAVLVIPTLIIVPIMCAIVFFPVFLLTKLANWIYKEFTGPRENVPS